MNLRSGWKENIIGQYRHSIKQVGFDGIQLSIEIPEGVKVYTATPDCKEEMLLPCKYRISYGAKCPEASFDLPDFERIAFAVVYHTK